MNRDKWQQFADQVTLDLDNYKTLLTTQTSESLESWHKIQNSVILAAIQHISNKNSQSKIYKIFFSQKHHLYTNILKN